MSTPSVGPSICGPGTWEPKVLPASQDGAFPEGLINTFSCLYSKPLGDFSETASYAIDGKHGMTNWQLFEKIRTKIIAKNLLKNLTFIITYGLPRKYKILFNYKANGIST